MSGRGSTARAVAAGCAVATTLAGLTLGATSATARFHEVPETGIPGYLVLRSDPGTPQWGGFEAGERAYWHIEAALADADRGELSVEVRAEHPPGPKGGAAGLPGLRVGVTACAQPFEGEFTRNAPVPPSCPDVPVTVLPPTPASALPQHRPGAGDPVDWDPGEWVVNLADLHAGHPRYLLVEISRPAEAGVGATGASTRIGIGVHARGADASDPSPALPATGARVLGRELLAAGLVVAGLLMVALERGIARARAGRRP